MFKKLFSYVVLIVSLFCIFGCSKVKDNQSKVANNDNSQREHIDETLEEKEDSDIEFDNDDLSIKIINTKCITEYPNDSTIEDVDTVEFGFYLQSNIESDVKEPIEWVILEKNNGKALLLSKYLLDCKKYHDDGNDVIWEECSLREWLNNEFYDTAFNKKEKNQIIDSELINSDHNGTYKFGGSPAHPELGEVVYFTTEGGNNTKDQVFLLSPDEIRKYFKSSDVSNDEKKILANGTNYAKMNNLYYGAENIDQEWYTGSSTYWLRGPGSRNNEAMVVYNDGDIIYVGVDSEDIGVRPAIWVEFNED